MERKHFLVNTHHENTNIILNLRLSYNYISIKVYGIRITLLLNVSFMLLIIHKKEEI